MKEKITNNRTFYLDFIKVLAILMVLYNHRATYTLALANSTINFKYVLLQLLATLCRCGVPLFFMASGVLLLKKQESLAHLFKHRILRILIVMVLCAFIRAYPDFTLHNLVEVFFTRLNWYLYAYLDYLLMLPFLRLIAKNASIAEARIFFILVMVFYTIGGCFYYFNYYTGLIEFAPIFNTQFASLCWSIIFPLMGFFIATHHDLVNGGGQITLLISTILTLFLSVYFVINDIQFNAGINTEHLRTHFIFAPSCLIFYLCKKIYEYVPLFQENFVNNIIVTISGTTFGIFIIETHSELINYINWKLTPMVDLIGPYNTGLLSIAIQFTVCFIITYLIRLIPFTRKIL